MLRKILAHLSIIFAGMCFVLFVVDRIKGGAMSFINNDISKAFIAILSLLTIAESVITLAAQTREQKLLRMVQTYRRKYGPSREMPAQQRNPARTAPHSGTTGRPASRSTTRTNAGSSGRTTAAAPRQRSGSANLHSTARSPYGD